MGIKNISNKDTGPQRCQDGEKISGQTAQSVKMKKYVIKQQTAAHYQQSAHGKPEIVISSSVVILQFSIPPGSFVNHFFIIHNELVQKLNGSVSSEYR